MRATTLLRSLLPVPRLILKDVEFADDGSLVAKASIRGVPRCAICGQKRPGYDTCQGTSRWRHLDLGWRRFYIEARVRRVDCKKCGIRVEQIPWAAPKSRFTYHFEDVVTWLAQRTDKTSTCELMGIDWRTVGRIIERVVSRRREPADLSNLKAISVDEISYRKGHRYLTLVVDLERGRVIWGKEGKSAEILETFFDEIGEEACAKITHCAIDMGEAYIKAVKARLPGATIVFDRFHVQRLVSDAVDDVRRELWRATERGSDERRVFKDMRHALLKNPWNLTPKQEDALPTLLATNKALYRAYVMKEAFADIFRHLYTVRTARRKFKAWLSWASRSRLQPFVKAARTIRKHFKGVLAYFETGYTTGMSEGFNNKARLATRRAYGFHSAAAFLAMIELTCPGIPVPLPHYPSS